MLDANRLSHEKKALFLGTALGAGNFLFLPELFSQNDFRIVLFLHFISLFLLGAPLLAGEIIWARWLRRNPVDAFAFLPKPLRFTAHLSFLAIAGIAPLYLLEVKNLFFWFLNMWSPVGEIFPLSKVLPISKELLFSILGIIFIVVFLIPPLRASRELLRKMFLWVLLIVAVLIVLALLWQPVSFWTVNKNFLLRPSRSLTVSFGLVLSVASMSLMTLSAGLGIHYLFTVWLSPLRRSGDEIQKFWKSPGRVHRMVLQIILFDFILTLVASVFLMPWLSLLPLEGSELSFSRVFMDWWPEYLQTFTHGLYVVRFLSLAIFLLGFLSLTSLVVLGVYITRLLLGRSGSTSLILFLSYLGISSLILSVPVFNRSLHLLAFDFLLPLSALFWSLSVGLRFPSKDLPLVVGRSQASDALTLLWHFSLRFLVPLFLLGYLVLRVLNFIFGTSLA
jgi:SNF family Na+-dependent transporter